MGRAEPVFRARASSAPPPAPASQGCTGPAPPNAACAPHNAPAAIRLNTAGNPSRKNAAKLTTTIASISASVATIPARPAAATVTPGAGAAGPDAGVDATSCGSAACPLTAARTSDQECQCALALTVPATPADAAATNAKTGSRSQGAGCPKKVSRAIPAVIHAVTHTMLTAAPGRTSSQTSAGSSSGA